MKPHMKFLFIFVLSAFALSWAHDAQAKRMALVVGIGNYENDSIEALRFAHADAQAVYNYLINPKIGQFKPKDVKVLQDDQATRANLLAALAHIQDTAGKDDMVFIYYAGHGAPELDREYDHADGYTKYLVPYDADPKNLFTTAVSTDTLENVFSKIKADCMVFIMDSCYSGGMGGRTFAKKIGGRSLRVMADPAKNLANKNFGKGRVVITAAKANQVAQEKNGHGVFTAALLEALEGAADESADGAVSLDELYKYVYKKVTRVTKNKQEPQKSGDITGEIILASATRGFVFEPGPDIEDLVRTGRRWMAPKWTMLAVTVAAAGATGGLYVTADNYFQSYQNAKENGSSDEGRLAKETGDFYNYTYIAAGVAGAAAVTMVTFFVLDHLDQRSLASSRVIPSFYSDRHGNYGPAAVFFFP